MLWHKDVQKWNSLDITEKLELLRKYYCTGPCGQSSSVLADRSALESALKTAIQEIDYYRDYIGQGSMWDERDD